ncbi:MAG: poly(A) polymerase [Myxococcales bacterium]|nr:poly(A) polymerase [Myxococcales bacterium]
MRKLNAHLIDADALRVVQKLLKNGHQAYLVGGCVRDLLLGRSPKDFDVATSATPNEIRAIFRNSRIIGRRFRLAHVVFGRKIIETSTFRANPRDAMNEGGDADLLITRDNVFGNEVEDAMRRDFTINGMFYDVERSAVIDHVDGLVDLDARLVRTIDDPGVRFQEDPVRMLRAIKFAARLDLKIEPDTYEAIVAWRGEIRRAAAPRVLEELYRLLRGGAAYRSMELLLETGMLAEISQQLVAMFLGDGGPASVAVRVGASVMPQVARVLDPEEARWHATWSDDPRQVLPAFALPHLDAGQTVTARAQAWDMLRAFDDMPLAADPLDIPNCTYLAAALLPFVAPLLHGSLRGHELLSALDEHVTPLALDLTLPRRERDEMRQLLVMQRGAGPKVKTRYRPGSAVELQAAAQAIARWAGEIPMASDDALDADDDATELGAEGSEEEAGDGDGGLRKRRRRRRGGKRRRDSAPMGAA